VAAWFALAGVTWSRGSEGGARGGFPTEAERRNKEGKVGAGLGAPPGEEKEGGGGGPATQGRRWGPGGAAASSFSGGGWVAVVQHGMEMGACGPARGGRKMGPTQEHSANFHLFQIFNCLEI
jgi:hypothetical protein